MANAVGPIEAGDHGDVFSLHESNEEELSVVTSTDTILLLQVLVI